MIYVNAIEYLSTSNYAFYAPITPFLGPVIAMSNNPQVYNLNML